MMSCMFHPTELLAGKIIIRCKGEAYWAQWDGGKKN